MTVPPPLDRDQALFVDLDGVLPALAPLTDAAAYQAERAALLTSLAAARRGALAILTGRTLSDIDRLLGPGRPVAAVHGLVRRRADGSRVEQAEGRRLDGARQALQPLLHRHPGLVLEDKTVGLAVHYRLAPQAADTVHEIVRRTAKALALDLQPGDQAWEVRLPGPDKGQALEAFMAEPPFAGRAPVAVGDHASDEAAFAAAAALGGFGVLVGPSRPTRARYGLQNATAMIDWLEQSLGRAA